MPTFYALVDAVPEKEVVVHEKLRELPLTGIYPLKEKSYDFLVAFEQPSFSTVDDFLQTHVRRIQHVKGVEVIVDWDDHGHAVQVVRKKLGL